MVVYNPTVVVETRGMPTPDAELVPAYASELACAAPTRSDTHPALVYLASLEHATSRRSMRSTLGTVAEVLTGNRDILAVHWPALRYQHVAALRAALGARLSRRGTNVALSAVKGVVREAVNLGLMPGEAENMIRRVKGMKVQDDSPAGRSLDAEETAALYAACEGDDIMARRDRALLTILFGGALRRHEVSILALSDYNPRTGDLAVFGKGSKRRRVRLSPKDRERVTAWVGARGGEAGPLLTSFTPHGELRRTPDGSLHPITETGIHTVLQRIAKRAGVADVRPHDARRTRATRMEAQGVKLTSIRRGLGHKSLETTGIYLRTEEEAALSEMATVSADD